MNATILCYTWDWTAVGGCSQACYPGGRKGLYLRSVPRCHDCLFTGRVITSICNDLFFRVFCVGNKQIVMPDTNIFFFFFKIIFASPALWFLFLVLLRCPLGSVSRFSLEQLWSGRWAEIHVSVRGLIIHHRKEWIVQCCIRRSRWQNLFRH